MSAGKFSADKGFGFDELTTLTFHLKKGYRQKLFLTVTVKSSRGGYTEMENYINSIEKYMDTFQVESP